MQAVRILRTFDGKTMSTQDFNGDGKPDLAGDFDGNGIVDVGGPNVPYFAAGESLGGIMSGIQGGIDPYMVASAPHVRRRLARARRRLPLVRRRRGRHRAAARSHRLLGAAVGAARQGQEVDPRDGLALRGDAALGPHRRQRGRREPRARDRLPRAERAQRAHDGRRRERRSTARSAARAPSKDGRFRVPIPSSTNDRLDIQIYNAAGRRAVVRRLQAPRGRRARRPPHQHVGAGRAAHARREGPDASRMRRAGWLRAVPRRLLSGRLAARRAERGLRLPAAVTVAAPLPRSRAGRVRPRRPDRVRALLHAEAAARPRRQPRRAACAAQHQHRRRQLRADRRRPDVRARGGRPPLPPALGGGRYPEYADYATPQEIYERLGRRTPMQFLVDRSVVEGIARLGKTSAGPTCKANYQARTTARLHEDADHRSASSARTRSTTPTG